MRIHITFSKTGPLIYVGNLDLLTIWERAARRAGLALSYTQGFHPQPKIHLAAPLPLGYSSRCEVLDMRLNEELDCASLISRLQEEVPDGIEILEIKSVDPGTPALQTEVRAAEYEIVLKEAVDASELRQRIEELCAASALPRERRGKQYDLRPLIEALEVILGPGQSEPRIRMRLSAREGATGRPDEVLNALGIERQHAQIERTALILRP